MRTFIMLITFLYWRTLILISLKVMGVLRWASHQSDDGLHELTTFCIDSDSVENSLVCLQQVQTTIPHLLGEKSHIFFPDL